MERIPPSNEQRKASIESTGFAFFVTRASKAPLVNRPIQNLSETLRVTRTVVDDYVLKDWVGEEFIIQVYKEKAIEIAEKDAKELVELARKNNGCSIPYPTYRCHKI